MQIKELILISLSNHLPMLGLFNRQRYKLLRLAGAKFTGKAIIFGPLNITPYSGIKNISFGENVFLNTEIRFGVPNAKVVIGDYCAIGPRVSFETTGHGLFYEHGNPRGSIYRDIEIKEGVWIGANVTILGGVTIGEGSVIAAGAVVTKNIPPYTLAGGIPARIIRNLKEQNTTGKTKQ